MKKSVLLATSAIVAFGATAANAVDVDMYGQVNKGLFAMDNGNSVETHFVDNDRSSTRFGVRGSQALDNGLTASVLFEGEMQENSSNSITGTAQSNALDTNATFAQRHARVGLAGNWGAIFMGDSSTATDGITEIDMAGANDVMGSGIDRIGGGTVIQGNGAGNTLTIGTATDVQFANLYNNFDGIGHGALTTLIGGAAGGNNHNDRDGMIRYDSPIFNGFQGRVATSQGGTVDGAVLYNGKIDAYEVKAGLGYAALNTAATGTDNIESTIAGSATIGHNSGLAGTVAYGQAEIENESAITDDPSFYYVKLGYTWDQFEVAGDYGVSELQLDAATANVSDGVTTTTTGNVDVETSSFGLAGQYNVGNGVSLGALYRYIEPEVDTLELEEQSFYGVNMRVKF